ncbi:hypothetical protein CDD81_468 [Ophiocordyceps australis]|uniref:DUF427 domain-containing protein n=1 Tax=Ophiocordyceps australis TaxID=1399860 RepID=A0A2C5Y2Z5_9HYPO|nr:hypothetical protein CDD81_468 [Ophiocordyceps australis]
MADGAKLNVQSFPRPPLLEKTPRHIRITYHGAEIVDTRDAYWVLETHHPPTYYIPRSAVKLKLTPTSRRTVCEWKGAATYYTARITDDEELATDLVWSYEEPTKTFAALRGHVALRADGPWECSVDGQRVEAQPGGFYGGWVTPDVEGVVKGRRGNWDPQV